MARTITRQTAAEAVATEAVARAGERPEFTFPVDIFDSEEEIVLVADMPGVAGSGVDVHLEKGNLTIRGRVSLPAEEGDWVLQEFRVGDYVRTFTVSEDVDPSGISAELRNGVLTLRLPKSEERKPRKIPVRGE
jgi:HSP20 family protein